MLPLFLPPLSWFFYDTKSEIPSSFPSNLDSLSFPFSPRFAKQEALLKAPSFPPPCCRKQEADPSFPLFRSDSTSLRERSPQEENGFFLFLFPPEDPERVRSGFHYPLFFFFFPDPSALVARESRTRGTPFSRKAPSFFSFSSFLVSSKRKTIPCELFDPFPFSLSPGRRRKGTAAFLFNSGRWKRDDGTPLPLSEEV